MGCAPSCGPTVGIKEEVLQQRKGGDEFNVPAPLPYTVGHGINKNFGDKAIVLIFGGPCSDKGLIMEELMRRFDFVPISLDDIVFSYLPNKIGQPDDQAHEIAAAIKADPGMLSLDWIFTMISSRISTSFMQRFVIDIIPEMTYLMKSHCFSKSDPDISLASFERKHPIMLALNVNVVFDEVEEKKKEDKGGPKLSKELNSVMQGIDDVNKDKTEKRIENYKRCVGPYLEYFERTRRMVKLTLRAKIPTPGKYVDGQTNSCSGQMTNTVRTVRHIIKELGFTQQRSLPRVIIFTMKEHFLTDIDLSYYRMKRIRLSDVSKRKDHMREQIQDVQNYIDKVGRHDENFAVVLDSLILDRLPPGKRAIFYDRSRFYLDEHIEIRSSRPPNHREKISAHLIESKKNTLMFMDPFSDSIAKSIGYVFGHLPSEVSTPHITPHEKPRSSS